jgi:hypothetical protein
MDNVPVRFIFIGIHIISKNVVELLQPLINSVVFSFNIKVETQVQAENRLVVSVVSVTITEQNRSLELANFKIACLFQIDNFSETIKANEQGVYIVPPDFEATTRPVSISTARGILYSELRGTYLNNAIMPVIYMDTFVEEQKKPNPHEFAATQ